MLSIQTFADDLSKLMLQELLSHQVQNHNQPILDLRSTPPDADTDVDDFLQNTIDDLKHVGKWPIKWNRVEKFSNDHGLCCLQRHKSALFTHLPLKTPTIATNTNVHKKVACSFCTSSSCKRDTTHLCGTCMVPLCMVPQKNIHGKSVGESCFVKWHECPSVDELRRHNKLQMNRLIETRSSVAVYNEETQPPKIPITDMTSQQECYTSSQSSQTMSLSFAQRARTNPITISKIIGN